MIFYKTGNLGGAVHALLSHTFGPKRAENYLFIGTENK